MAANTQSTQQHDVFCPDPSAHQKTGNGLSAQASTAALYATQPGKGQQPGQDASEVLGTDGKLSSRSAAASLKYAKATDLPSFPSRGGDSNAAGAAAMLAKDYKMKELWQPEQSAAGSKAALLAQKDGGKLDLWQYEQSKNGLSAATLAMKKNTQTPLSPNLDRGYTETGKSNSLLAATKSTSSNRQRAGSTPIRPPPQYPDQQNSARNALSAATASHRSSVRVPANKDDGWSSEANQAARIQNSHMDKQMFGSAPPVEPEIEEQKRQAALRASAVSMAKKMYDVQNRARLETPPDDNSSIMSGETAHRRNASAVSQPDLKQEAMKYITLQDQAHKLAQERLAKVDKDMENTKYREYYGYGDRSPRKSRLSMRGRPRNRAASEGANNSDDSDDEVQARRIRKQMSQLNTATTTVSDKQRDDDRARLMKAAEKRVHDRLQNMDEKVFLETGKPSQAMMEDWEAKARDKAEKDRAEREKHPGKTHIGGGKYMDQSEIEAIAAARLKPTLDQLDDNATKRREREAEIARKKDAAETERMEEKMRNDQQKAEFKKIKEQDKAAARKEKEERKAAQRDEKIRKSEDQRKSREMKRDTAAATTDDDREPTDTKDKRKSLFGRFTDKFKKDDKPQSEKTEDKAVGATTGATVPAAGVAATSGTDKSVAENDSLYDVSSRDAEGPHGVESTGMSADKEGSSHGGTAAAATAGMGAAGAGAFASTRSNKDDDASSVSGSDRGLQQVETARSDLPLQSPSVDHRPDLERHISTIGSSSGEGSDSDELSDSDDDDARGRPGSKPGYFGSTSKPAAPEEAVSPVQEGEREHIPIPVLGTPLKEHADPVEPETEVASEPAPAVSTEKSEPAVGIPAAAAGPSVSESKPKEIERPESAAAAPVVATGPSTADTKSKEVEKPEKEEKRGFRGLFSRLKGRDKETKPSDGKLHKERTSSEQPTSEKSFQGGAKYTTPQKKDDSDGITPVTTTSAEAADTKPHVGSDGPIGGIASTSDETPVSRPTSVSSFKRHDAAPRDLDEVSSSGAEEEDHERGRSGGGLGRGKREKAVEGRESEDQFEEARDHFDESLAPPAAFAGQPKSQSPVRETKFVERFE